MIFLYEICENISFRSKKAPMWDVYGEPRGPKAENGWVMRWCFGPSWSALLPREVNPEPKRSPDKPNQNKGLLGVSSMYNVPMTKIDLKFSTRKNFDTLGISWDHGRADMHACFLMLSDMSTSAGALDIYLDLFFWLLLVWQPNREPSLNLLNCGIVNRFYCAMLLLATACWERLFTK